MEWTLPVRAGGPRKEAQMTSRLTTSGLRVLVMCATLLAAGASPALGQRVITGRSLLGPSGGSSGVGGGRMGLPHRSPFTSRATAQRRAIAAGADAPAIRSSPGAGAVSAPVGLPGDVEGLLPRLRGGVGGLGTGVETQFLGLERGWFEQTGFTAAGAYTGDRWSLAFVLGGGSLASALAPGGSGASWPSLPRDVGIPSPETVVAAREFEARRNSCWPTYCYPSYGYAGWFYGWDDYHYDTIDGYYAPVDPALYTGAPSAPAAPAPAVAPPAAPLTDREQGDAFLLEGRYDEAVRAYTRHLDADPTDAGALRALGLALLADGKVPEGVASIARAYRAAPALADYPLVPGALPGGERELRRIFTRVSLYANRVGISAAWLTAAVVAQGEGRLSVAIRMVERARAQGIDGPLCDRLLGALR